MQSAAFTEFVPGQIWLRDYPVTYSGTRFFARTAVVRLKNGSLFVHSPSPLDDHVRSQIQKIGPVLHIVAPGTYHYLHVPAWQEAFPEASTHICPGLESKRPDLRYTTILSDIAPETWSAEIEQVVVQGPRFMSEVAFLHRETKTLLLVDLIENIGDSTPGTDAMLRFWWKVVFRMWNRPKPAPEYQLGWGDKKTVQATLHRILEWDFDRIVLAHGNLIEQNAKDVARQAWARPLGWQLPAS